nr:hypothetical protein [Tanacetum cinerariifolium]
MLVMVTIVHLKFCMSIRNRVTIKTLISRKICMIFNNNVFVVKIAGLLMKLTNQYTTNHPVFNVQNDLFDSQNKLMKQLTSMCDMVGQFIQKKEEEKRIEEEQVANARYWKIPACNDDDDNDYTFAITPNESVNSLRIDETDCYPKEETHFIKRLLYDNSSPHPPEEFVSKNSDAAIQSISPSPILVEDIDSLMEEIDLSFTLDYPMPPGIDEDDYDSERGTLILEEFLSNDSLSLPKNESFHFDIPSFSRPPAKSPDGNTGILNEKSPDLLSHLGPEAFQPSAECPMMIHG